MLLYNFFTNIFILLAKNCYQLIVMSTCTTSRKAKTSFTAWFSNFSSCIWNIEIHISVNRPSQVEWTVSIIVFGSAILVQASITNAKIYTGQVSSMIHSARHIVANIVFAWNLFCFEKWMTCAKTKITTGRDCGSAWWINKTNNYYRKKFVSFICHQNFCFFVHSFNYWWIIIKWFTLLSANK